MPPLGREARTPHDIDVYYQWTEAMTDGALGQADRVLAAGERARRDRLIHAGDRRDYTAAHALLRTALSASGQYAPSEWQFVTGEHGKPFLMSTQAGAPPIAFNLSHTRGLVACVVSRGRMLGVDVERHTRVDHGPMIAERFFAALEVEALGACAADDYPARFTELWTLKESYIKGVGLGLSLPLRSFAFEFVGDTGLRLQHAEAAESWHFWLARLGPDARLAVAVSGDAPPGGWQIGFHLVGDGPELRCSRSSI